MNRREAIARIDVARSNGPPIRGTGALVGERLVLTALHVVADRRSSPPVFYAGPIQLGFPGHTTTATVIDGLWDRDADWVLLYCADAPRTDSIPLGELGADENDLVWETFGFPDAKPDGIRLVGKIIDPEARYQGAPVIQLYSDQAAAGDGAPVAGLSGAPCIVDGALVGIIRSSLLSDGRNVGGTLFACPLSPITVRAADRLPLPDPYRGLPGLPRRDLPPSPYRYLRYYAQEDAEVFFGRGAEIRSVYEKITAPDAPRLLVLSGQSGVGKSSLLDAGIAPRIIATHAYRYVRRERERGLSRCLEAGADEIESDTTNRPGVIVLDQVEEAWTRPSGDPAVEVQHLLGVLPSLLKRQPALRVVLSLRKEWLPELLARLEERRLPYGKHFLDRLDENGIIEVVHGFESTKRLRRHYGAHVDGELGVRIAADLLGDYGSPIAPTLQILMTRLWERATEEAPGAPHLSLAKYEVLKREGLHLDDFLRRQIGSLPPDGQPFVESGLIQDLLEAHTTAVGTAESLTRNELGARYPHLKPATIDKLIGDLDATYLITHPRGRRDKTRLAHDTLSPFVREGFRVSQRPGQRARRIVEARAPDWEDGRSGVPLDPRDLQLVEEGLSGMRALTTTEQRLIAASIELRVREQDEEQQRCAREEATTRRLAEEAEARRAEKEKRIQAEANAARQLAEEAEARRLAEAARANEAERRQHEQRAAARRFRFAATVAFGVALCSGALAVVAFNQRRSAVHSRAEADRVMKFMLGELYSKMEKVGRLDVLDTVAREAIRHFENTTDDDSMNARAVALTCLGHIQQDRGDVSAAIASFTTATQIQSILVAKDPTNEQWQHDLATSYNGIGDVQRVQGHLEEAMAAYQHQLAVVKRNADRHADDTSWQLDVANAEDNVGDVYYFQKLFDQALVAYRRAKALRERLKLQHSDLTVERAYTFSLNKIGDTLLQKSEITDALAAYEEALKMRKRLLEQEPGNSLLQRDLLSSYRKYGKALLDQRRLTDASDAFQHCRDLAKKLTEKDPQNRTWQRDAAVCEKEIANVMQLQGDRDAAVRSYHSALEELARLVALDDKNSQWKGDLAAVHEELAALYSADGHVAKERAEWKKAGTLLLLLDQSNAMWRDRLARINERLKQLGQ